MAPKKQTTVAEKGKRVSSSAAPDVDPGLEADIRPMQGRARRRTRDQIERDEREQWELSFKTRKLKAERHIIRDSFQPGDEVIRAVDRQGLSFWFERNLGYNTELVVEFYKNYSLPEEGKEFHPDAFLQSKVGRAIVRVTPDIIAGVLRYHRPTVPTNYPVSDSEFEPEDVVTLLYSKRKNAQIPHRPGKFRPSFRFVNQLVCYNLDPRATENKPSVTTGNMMFSFMHEDTVCDWARFIFLKMVEFRDAPTQTRMPFPCLISAIVRAADQGGQLAAKYYRNDELSPGPIDSSNLKRSAAHSSGARSALLEGPPANASTITWLKKIFYLEVAVAKSQQKLKKEVRQGRRQQLVQAHQNKWMIERMTGQSSASYQPVRFPAQEDSDDFDGSDSD